MTVAHADGLVDLFSLDQLGPLTWTGRCDGVPLPQLFGGQLMAQSIMAAGCSLREGQVVHSLHTTFVNAGRSGETVTYVVETLRDGSRVSVREVKAWQGETLICRSTVTGTAEFKGITHSRRQLGHFDLSGARTLEEISEPDGGLGEFWEGFESIEIRIPESADGLTHGHSAVPLQHLWMRATEALGDDPTIHRAAIAYASDLMLMSAALAPHGIGLGQESTLARDWLGVSLDHTMWFQRHIRADAWFLTEQATPSASGGFAIVTADIFDGLGQVACHVTQEALIVPNPGPVTHT